MVRDVWLYRYPDGVSVEEGEKWYLGTHVHEVKQIPGVRKYLAWKVIDLPERPTKLVRLTEVWWDDIDTWRRVWPERTKWIKTPAPWGGPPSLIADPVFLDEKPEYDLMTDIPKL